MQQSIGSLPGLRSTKVQCCSIHNIVDLYRSARLEVDTKLLKDISKGLNKRLNIQNFQFSIVLVRTYSSNISCILLSCRLETGAPVAGKSDWQLLQDQFNSAFSSLKPLHLLTWLRYLSFLSAAVDCPSLLWAGFVRPATALCIPRLFAT